MPEKESDQIQQNTSPGVDLSHPAFSNSEENYEPKMPNPEVKNAADGITEAPKAQNYFEEQPSSGPETKNEMQYYDSAPESKLGKNRLALIIAGGVILVLLLAGGSFLLLAGKKDTSENQAVTEEAINEESQSEEDISESSQPAETDTKSSSSSSSSQSTTPPPAVEKKPIETPQPETPSTNSDGSVNASG